MRKIKQSQNAERWPRKAVASVEARKRDLVIRVSDWTRDRDEPAYDVEVFIGGVYDWNESECHTLYEYGGDASKAKAAAIAYAQSQIAKLL
jgi:hypothetical protein